MARGHREAGPSAQYVMEPMNKSQSSQKLRLIVVLMDQLSRPLKAVQHVQMWPESLFDGASFLVVEPWFRDTFVLTWLTDFLRFASNTKSLEKFVHFQKTWTGGELKEKRPLNGIRWLVQPKPVPVRTPRPVNISWFGGKSLINSPEK